MTQDIGDAEPASERAGHSGQEGAKSEGNEQQEPDTENHRERKEPFPQQPPNTSAGLGFDFPNRVKRVLEFPENPGGACEKGKNPDDGGDQAATFGLRRHH